MKRTFIILILSVVCGLSSLTAQDTSVSWEDELKELIQIFGHRNWILVVDAAYPMQSNEAIKTICTDEKQLDVVKDVLALIKKAPHIYPEVFLDKEIDFVPEQEAKGITDYKKNLFKLLKDKNVTKVLHEELIANIDEAAKTFNILVLKTNLTIPYTSVFLRLDCGYWNAEQEKKIREIMK